MSQFSSLNWQLEIAAGALKCLMDFITQNCEVIICSSLALPSANTQHHSLFYINRVESTVYSVEGQDQCWGVTSYI